MKAPVFNDGMKTCTGSCGQELPSTSDYFDRDETRDDGLRSVCKICRAKERDRAEHERIDERVKAMDDNALGMLQYVARTGSDVPHIAELYQRLMEVYEGAGGYAAHFMAQYLMAKPGSTTRTKMLELVMRIAQKVSDSGTAQIPVDLMSDEDLQIVFEKGVKKFTPRLVHDNGTTKEAS